MATRKPAKKPVVIHLRAGETLVCYRTKKRSAKKTAKRKPAKRSKRKPAKRSKRKAAPKKKPARHPDGFGGWA